MADDPERQVLQAVVIDSHRPFSIQNVYADTLDENGEFLQAGDIEKARVLLVHDPAIELEIPDSETTRLALMEEEEEEDEAEEEPLKKNENGWRPHTAALRAGTTEAGGCA